MKVLLVEPNYPRKYPPLGLMKISTWHKRRGDVVEYKQASSFIGIDFKPELIYITSLFTWDLPVVISTIKSFKHRFPKAEIRVGGVGATAMPEYIKKNTDITPHCGVIKEIDNVPPDYSISDETKNMKESMAFTSRGCPHNCKYCIVGTLEPKPYIIKNWQKSIDVNKPNIVLFDNNLLYSPKDHVETVFKTLKKLGKQVDINSGFDVFLFKKHHAENIASLPIKPIRFAFDKKSQEKALIRSVKYCTNLGIKPGTMRIFVLYNYHDDIKDAQYRADKVIELGCKPFVMRYKPLDWLKKEMYVSERWTREGIVNFTYYYNMPTVWNTMTYDEFISERKDNMFEKIRKELRKNNTPKEQQFLDI